MIFSAYCAGSAPQCLKAFLNAMRIDVICYEPHTLSSSPFNWVLFFNSFIDFCSCKVVSLRDMRKKRDIKFRALCIVNGGCLETLNSLHERICEFLHFVMSYMKQIHETKQKTQTCTNSLERTVRTGLEIILKELVILKTVWKCSSLSLLYIKVEIGY